MFRPLKGVVIDRSADGMVIRLNSGTRITWPRRRNIQLGDLVYVGVDYTTLVPSLVLTQEEYDATEEVSEPELLDYEEEQPRDDPLDFLIDPSFASDVSL